MRKFGPQFGLEIEGGRDPRAPLLDSSLLRPGLLSAEQNKV